MYITLQQFKDAIKNIKSEWNEGVNDSHTLAHYRGVSKGLDTLIEHFQELDDFTKWKKDKRDANKKD